MTVMDEQDTDKESASGTGRWVAGLGGAAAGGGAAYALNHRGKDAIHRAATDFGATLTAEAEKANGSFDTVKPALSTLTDAPDAHEAAEKLFKHRQELAGKEATSSLTYAMPYLQKEQEDSGAKAFGALNSKDPFNAKLGETIDELIKQGKNHQSPEVQQAIQDAIHAKIEPYFNARQNACQSEAALAELEKKMGGDKYALREKLFGGDGQAASKEWKNIQNQLSAHYGNDTDKILHAKNGIKGALEDAYKSGGELDERTRTLLSSGRYDGIAADIEALFKKGHDIGLAGMTHADHLSDVARKEAENLASRITNDEALGPILDAHAQNPQTAYASIRQEVGTHLPRICEERMAHVKGYVDFGSAARILQQEIDTAAQEATRLKAATPALEENCIGKIAGAMRRSKLKVPGGEGAVVAAGALAAGAAALGIHSLLSKHSPSSHLEKLQAERQSSPAQTPHQQ